ncbi:hypothetical protein V500_10043, partial [Pseudogymnoascus sp. VKM F-4518 (FW-2643)]
PHPNSTTSSDVTANNAVAPAGGCTVFVTAITAAAAASATASAPASHLKRSNSSGPSDLKASAINIPTVAEMAWPSSNGRGCASGEAGVE